MRTVQHEVNTGQNMLVNAVTVRLRRAEMDAQIMRTKRHANGVAARDDCGMHSSGRAFGAAAGWLGTG